MDQLATRLMGFLDQANSPLGLSILALSAMIEYIFPPFPGDTVTLFGAVLITSKGWSFWPVFGSVLFGSAAGSMLDFWIGTWIHRRQSRAGHDPAKHKKLNMLVERFKKHGAVWLVLNRFMPGVRALFFVAAGMAEMKAWSVLFWSTVSATLWNLCIIGVGATLGANFDELKGWVGTYSVVAWSVMGVALVIVLIVLLARRRRARLVPRISEGPGEAAREPPTG